MQLPGAARDIGIGGNGAVWIIGTNSLNDSFQVYSWNGSSWVADAGSGREIDVTANGEPMVDGADGKVWIRDGGNNSGWSQFAALTFPGVTSTDEALSPCARNNSGDPGGSELWIVDAAAGSPLITWNSIQWSGPSEQNNSPNAPTGIFGNHLAVDTSGHVFAVQTGFGGGDVPGQIIERVSQ